MPSWLVFNELKNKACHYSLIVAQFLDRYIQVKDNEIVDSGGANHLARKSGNFGLKSNGKVIFRKLRSEIWNTFRDTPVFPFRTERRKFPYHLLNFPVSSLPSAENNYWKSKRKW